MSNDLALLMDQTPSKDRKDFDDLSGGKEFPARIQLMNALSVAVSEGLAKAGDFCLVKGKEVTNLGASIDLVAFDWRPTAIDTSNPEAVRFTNDKDSDVFKEIQEASGEKDSGCMYGPEFLVYIAGHGFAHFLFGSKSARMSARPMVTLLEEKSFITVSSDLITSKKYRYYVPSVKKCSTPLTQLPTKEEVSIEIERFNRKPLPETVEPETRSR